MRGWPAAGSRSWRPTQRRRRAGAGRSVPRPPWHVSVPVDGGTLRRGLRSACPAADRNAGEPFGGGAREHDGSARTSSSTGTAAFRGHAVTRPAGRLAGPSALPARVVQACAIRRRSASDRASWPSTGPYVDRSAPETRNPGQAGRVLRRMVSVWTRAPRSTRTAPDKGRTGRRTRPRTEPPRRQTSVRPRTRCVPGPARLTLRVAARRLRDR